MVLYEDTKTNIKEFILKQEISLKNGDLHLPLPWLGILELWKYLTSIDERLKALEASIAKVLKV